MGFDPSSTTGSQNSLAPIPVARIIDTTDPAQTSAVPSGGTNRGLAEYTNANFLSEDTIFKDFTFPRVESLGAPEELANPVTGRSRRYFRKVAEGDTGYHLVAEGVWWETLASLAAGDQGFVLDSEVWNGYASKLFPRATGYSAGLIDYFFRTAVAADVYVDTCGEPQETFPFQMAIVPTAFFTDPINNTAVAERAGAGRVVAVARYTYGGQTHYFTLLDTVVSLHFDAECGCDVTDVTISSAPLAQVPQGAALEQDWTVVYRGPLGQETDAVIGGRGNFWGLSC